jgi:glutamyl-tRNA reductase
MFILSTCNRTEIYGYAESAEQLANLLCSKTTGTKEEFDELAYKKEGNEAILHLFEVAAGLDSQILGDYEIVGQIRQAIKIAKEHNSIGTNITRLVNAALQSSKEIKNKTGLSGGTVSVSFAAVQYIRDHIVEISDKKILLLGTGKIGRNTTRNLVDYLQTKNITLINRTAAKAEKLAAEMDLSFATTEELDEQVRNADIILTATNSPEPVITRQQLSGHGNKLIIDLAVPGNVAADAMNLEGISVVNVDQLAKIKDETLQHRVAEIPRAKEIIDHYFNEFLVWHALRKHVPVLKTVKTTLQHIQTSYSASTASSFQIIPPTDGNEKIQRAVNGMAVKMRRENQWGCYFIQAINEYIAV